MKKLIAVAQKVIGAEKVNSVNARELHERLGAKKDFSSWIKAQIKSLGLDENVDYIKLTQKGELSKTGQWRTEYILTLDAAKHIAMASRTQRGKEIRDYFIEVEKRYRQAHASPAKIGELEQRIHMLKRENTELKRAINRLTYNQKQTTESKRKIFIDDNGNEIDLLKLWNRGVFPYIPRAVKELREKIAKEMGSLGYAYQAKLLEIERLFSAKPLRIGNGVIVGSVMFPDALLESRPEKDMPVIGR